MDGRQREARVQSIDIAPPDKSTNPKGIDARDNLERKDLADLTDQRRQAARIGKHGYRLRRGRGRRTHFKYIRQFELLLAELRSKYLERRRGDAAGVR